MNYLQDYLESSQTLLFNELGVFLAFNREQFDEGVAKHQDKKPSGTKWANLGMGMYMPSINVEAFKTRHTEMIEAAMATDVAENGRQGVIVCELNNYECLYAGDMHPALEILEDYGITADEVRSVFRLSKAVKVGASCSARIFTTPNALASAMLAKIDLKAVARR